MKVIAKPASRASRGRNLTLVWGEHKSPVGKLMVAISADGLCWTGINCSQEKFRKSWQGANFVHDDKATASIAKDIIKNWNSDFSKIKTPVVLYGTPFQLKVWKELLKIKSGKTTTYEALAKKIGKPKAVRAVGSACGKNTVSVVVPCHRVINKSGSRINYGWGAPIKIALLKGEKAI